MKPTKITFQIEVEIDKKGQYKLFGLPSHICPEHSKAPQDIKECFLDNLAANIQWFGVINPKGMTKDAKMVKGKILTHVQLEVNK